MRAQLELANDRFKKRGLRLMLYPGLLNEFVRIPFDICQCDVKFLLISKCSSICDYLYIVDVCMLFNITIIVVFVMCFVTYLKSL